MSALATALEEAIDEAIDEALDKAVGHHIEEYNFADVISEAICNSDLNRQVETAVEEEIRNLDLEEKAEKAVEEEIRNLDLEEKAEKAVEDAFDEQSTGKFKEIFLELMKKDKGFLEEVTKALFEPFCPL